ncbi:MAG: amidohydrolase family protein [Candidatus Hodarchaeota archaeon]
MPTKWFFQYALLGEQLRLAEEVILHIENGFFKQIEEKASLNDADEVFSNALVFPAFINAHTHLGDSVAKEAAWNVTIDEAVGKNGVKFRKLREEASEIPRAVQAILQDMARCGVAAFADFREEGTNGVSFLRELIKNHFMKAIILGRPTAGISDLKSVISISDGLGIPTTNHFSDHELKEIRGEVKQSKKLLAVHCAETEEERQRSLKIYGKNDVVRAIKLLEADILIHMTKATQKDLRLVKEHGARLVFCPRSNAYFGTGFPPVQEALDMEIPAALGTDNVMVTHPDPLQEARWLALQLRLRGEKPDPRKILRMITVNPAKMFGLTSGILEEGKKADILAIDLNSPRTSFCDDPTLALLMRATPEDYMFVSNHSNSVFSANMGKSL